MFVVLKPRSERTLTADQVIEELRPKLAASARHARYLTNPPTIQVGGRMTRALYQLTLQGADTDELYRYGEDARSRRSARCRTSPTSAATCR